MRASMRPASVASGTEAADRGRRLPGCGGTLGVAGRSTPCGRGACRLAAVASCGTIGHAGFLGPHRVAPPSTRVGCADARRMAPADAGRCAPDHIAFLAGGSAHPAGSTAGGCHFRTPRRGLGPTDDEGRGSACWCRARRTRTPSARDRSCRPAPSSRADAAGPERRGPIPSGSSGRRKERPAGPPGTACTSRAGRGCGWP